jgi:hypothetical protein
MERLAILIVPVQMHFVVDAVGGIPLLQLAHDVRLARDCAERWNPVVGAHKLIGDGSGFDASRFILN